MITREYSSLDICKLLTFEEAVRLAYTLFHKNMFDDDIQYYAYVLTKKIKELFLVNWDADWKLDVFLGHMCEFASQHHEQYLSYKRAFDKLQDPPDSLLLLLAGCINSPDNTFITEEESANYLQRALAKKYTYEAAMMMRHYHQIKRNMLEVQYWNVLCDELEKNNTYTDPIIPDVIS